MKQFKANCFIGFYSTVPSTPLIERLGSFRDKGEMQSFEFFGNKRIESLLVQRSMSVILSVFFPRSNHNVRPLAKLYDQHLPLSCVICGRDLLDESIVRDQMGLISFGWQKEGDYPHPYVCVNAVCKGECDVSLSKKLYFKGILTDWDDISDFANPIYFAKYVAQMPSRWADEKYKPGARKDMGRILLSLAQRVMRTPTSAEMKAYADLTEYVIAAAGDRD